MLLDPPKGAAHPSFIFIPGMGGARVVLPQLLNEGEVYQTTRHHCQWISLGHSLLTKQEATCPISHLDHQISPVVVAVESEPHTTGPLMPHHPQHLCMVFLIESIARVNEEEPPVLLLGVLLPQKPQYVDPPPSITASIPPQSCSVPQASLESYPITTNTHFFSIRRQVSPTPTRCTPSHLLRPKRRPNIIEL